MYIESTTVKRPTYTTYHNNNSRFKNNMKISMMIFFNNIVHHIDGRAVYI